MRFQCDVQFQLSARVDAVMQSTSLLLHSVSADKAEVLEDVISRRVPVLFLGVLAGASQFVAKVRTNSGGY